MSNCLPINTPHKSRAAVVRRRRHTLLTLRSSAIVIDELWLSERSFTCVRREGKAGQARRESGRAGLRLQTNLDADVEQRVAEAEDRRHCAGCGEGAQRGAGVSRQSRLLGVLI